jgi:aerobic-type carbon monoxide dehydrogenase small subunit (CoxS/CutS family)
MNTNLCRCCGYPKVLAAVKRAATLGSSTKGEARS